MQLNIKLFEDEKLDEIAKSWLGKPVTTQTLALAHQFLRKVEMSCAMAQEITADEALEVLFLRGFIKAFDKMQQDAQYRAARHAQVDRDYPN